MRQIHPVTRNQGTGADRLSSMWLDYAQKHETEYSADTELERKLKALTDYTSPEVRLRANNSALKGANEVVDLFIWEQEQLKLAHKKNEVT